MRSLANQQRRAVRRVRDLATRCEIYLQRAAEYAPGTVAAAAARFHAQQDAESAMLTARLAYNLPRAAL